MKITQPGNEGVTEWVSVNSFSRALRFKLR